MSRIIKAMRSRERIPVERHSVSKRTEAEWMSPAHAALNRGVKLGSTRKIKGG